MLFLVNWSVALTSLGTMYPLCEVYDVVPLFVDRGIVCFSHARYLHGRGKYHSLASLRGGHTSSLPDSVEKKEKESSCLR